MNSSFIMTVLDNFCFNRQVRSGNIIQKHFYFYDAIEAFHWYDDIGIIPWRDGDTKLPKDVYVHLIAEATSAATTKKRSIEQKEFFQINGHMNPVVKKQRVAPKESRDDVKKMSEFLQQTQDRFEQGTFNDVVHYLLKALYGEIEKPFPNFTSRLLKEVIHFSPKKLLNSFIHDFKDYVFFCAEDMHFSVTPKDVFYTTFVDYIVQTITK